MARPNEKTNGDKPRCAEQPRRPAAFLAVCIVAAAAITAAVAVPGEAAADTDPPVLVFAAASLADALSETAEAFAPDGTPRIVFSFAGSAALARQILLGAPADLFLSASPDWIDLLEAEGRVEEGSRRALLGNALVLIEPASATADRSGRASPAQAPELTRDFEIAARLDGGRLAIGLVEAVPAGRYAREALQSLALWEDVADRLAETDNVRAALSLVATGAAPLGIVYATDAMAEPRVRVLARIPARHHAPITYPVVDLTGRDSPAEDAFLTFLTGPEAAGVFARHGFVPLGAAQ